MSVVWFCVQVPLAALGFLMCHVGHCDRQRTRERTLRGVRCCCYFILTLYVSLPFHFSFTTSFFHSARHIEAIDMHRCLLCLHGFVMRSPGSWLGGSRVSALRPFCLAPFGHLVNVGFELLLQRWPAQDGAHKLPGRYVSTLLWMCHSTVILWFWFSFVCVFVFFVVFCFLVVVFVLALCFWLLCFSRSPWNHIISVHYEPEAYYSIGFYCRIHTASKYLHNDLARAIRRWSKKKVSRWTLWNIGGTIHAGMKAVTYWMFRRLAVAARSSPALLGRPQLVGLVLAACPTAKTGVAVTRDYEASAS